MSQHVEDALAAVSARLDELERLSGERDATVQAQLNLILRLLDMGVAMGVAPQDVGRLAAMRGRVVAAGGRRLQ